jgi:hypothetical protein
MQGNLELGTSGEIHCQFISTVPTHTISGIQRWREAYNFSTAVKASRLGDCKAFLIRDTTYPHESIKITDGDCSAAAESYSPTSFGDSEQGPNCYYAFSCKLRRVEVRFVTLAAPFDGIEVLERISFLREDWSETSLSASPDYIDSYLQYSTHFLYLDPQSYLIGVNTTYLVATPEKCEGSPQENMTAVVSVRFVISENDTQVTFDFGNTSLCGECGNCSYIAPEGTEIISGFGWGERPMITSTDCYYYQSNVGVITNLSFHAYGDPPGKVPYIQNPNLTTPYTKSPSDSYLYNEDISDPKQHHTPMFLGCGNASDVLSSTNLISRHPGSFFQFAFKAFFVIIWVLASFSFYFYSQALLEHADTTDGEASKIEKSFESVCLIGPIFKCICCCFKTGKVERLAKVIINACLFPFQSIYPDPLRFRCFTLWVTTFNLELATTLAIMWIMSISVGLIACALIFTLSKSAKSPQPPETVCAVFQPRNWLVWLASMFLILASLLFLVALFILFIRYAVDKANRLEDSWALRLGRMYVYRCV